MIRPIVKDILFLQRKAEKASRKDAQAGQDLLDTLAAHSDTCVGLAANMIGSTKAIIAIKDGSRSILMYNPVLVKTSPSASAAAMTGSKSAMRMRISTKRKNGLTDGRRKSSSMKWTTCREY